MKLHNISDVSTSKLASVGLVNANATVAGKTIKPGESAEFKYLPPEAARLIRMGVLAHGDKPPQEYLRAKGASADKPAEPSPPARVPEPPPMDAPAAEAPTDPAPMPEPERPRRRFRSEE